MEAHGFPLVAAPEGTSRLVPSRFPPVSAFERVAAADDLETVMELEGWTNDRLTAHRLSMLDQSEWVFGRPNASVVMAAFMHGSRTGMRFSGTDLGAWYCSTELMTAVLEVANGMRKEIAVSGVARLTSEYRQYTADLAGDYVDVSGDLGYSDPSEATYSKGQALGHDVRFGDQASGIRYDSARRKGHDNWVCYRPTHVQNVTQADHFEIDVPPTGKVVVRKLSD